ncbi:unnamed protein product [Cladocopium goreaui]|uniref:BD-FAE-like domain-containing protein n=1 Tax=Cladocopium goreaui TaxID=2562237 RepID=A0A9P1GPX5_9DINO|nr:unnamed protein product [Cladocopium goreaui]
MPTTAAGKKIEVVHDVCYHPLGPAVASSAQFLDVYVPPEAKEENASLPVVVFLHGGGWRRGSRRSNIFHFFQNVGLVLADQGFVAVLPSYRKSLPYAPWLLGMLGATALTLTALPLLFRRQSTRSTSSSVGALAGVWGGLALILRQLIRWVSPGVRHPAHLEDCARAVGWVQQGGTRAFGGDPGKVVLLGNSAGAHLASLLALDASKASTEIPSPLRGLIAISGIYCGQRFYQSWLMRHMFGYVFDDHPSWDDCFPLGRCPDPSDPSRPDSSSQLEGLCPVLLINAAFDVGLQPHAEDFAKRLRQCGAQVSGPVVLPGTDHFRMLPLLGRTQRSGGRVSSREDRELLPLISDFVRRVCQ